ncbi:MAG TPA: DUF697 domain-containing protein [Saprospiraceae bacterium]|nr:DUF697 domain-containing protein [Saprospiraceae bacterium]
MSETKPDKKVTNKSQQANSTIKNHMIWAMGAGFIPVPFADFFAIAAIQLDMVRQLCKIYGVDFTETKGKAFVTSLAGSGFSGLGARAVKFLPGVGSVLGGVTLAVLAGGSTYALGEVFKKHFETGGTFLDFDPERLRKYYDEKFEKGKEIAREMKKKEEDKEKKAGSVDVIDRLRDLGKMKMDGLITEEEYEHLKKKLMGDQ